MSKKVKIVLAILIGTSCLLVFFYQKMGGFKPVETTLTEVPTFIVAGKYFEGDIRSAGLNKLLSEVEEIYRNQKLSGTFTICYFGDPDEQRQLKVMAGISNPDTTQLPQGFELHKIEGGLMAKAEMTSHVVVAPSSSNTNGKLRELAEKAGYQLTNQYIEQYFNERKVVTLIPVTEK